MPLVPKLPPCSAAFLEKGRKREKMQKRKRRLYRLIKKALQSLRPQAQRSPIIFFGDMCGEENTSQAANVRVVRRKRTARALQSGRKPFCQKGFLFDSLKRRLSRFRDRRLVFGVGGRSARSGTLSARSSWRRWCCRSTASWRSRAGRRRARRCTAGARRACRAFAARCRRRGFRAGAGA